MPTCVGHSLVGYALASSTKVRFADQPGLSLLGFIILANLPDIDFLPGYLVGRPGVYHRGALHSFAAALLAGTSVGIVFWLRGRQFLPYFGVTTATYTSHLLLDWLGNDTSGDPGIQLLWPLTKKFFMAPVPVFMNFDKSATSEGFLRSLWNWNNLHSLVWEVGVLLSFFLVWRLARRRS